MCVKVKDVAMVEHSMPWKIMTDCSLIVLDVGVGRGLRRSSSGSE